MITFDAACIFNELLYIRTMRLFASEKINARTDARSHQTWSQFVGDIGENIKVYASWCSYGQCKHAPINVVFDVQLILLIIKSS